MWVQGNQVFGALGVPLLSLDDHPSLSLPHQVTLTAHMYIPTYTPGWVVSIYCITQQLNQGCNLDLEFTVLKNRPSQKCQQSLVPKQKFPVNLEFKSIIIKYHEAMIDSVV